MTERTPRGATAALALAGIGVTSYLVYARYTRTQIACTTGGCETSSTRSTPSWPASRSPCSASRLRHLAGLAFAVYLIVIQVAVIDAICQWCIASDGILTVLAVPSVARLLSATPRPAQPA